MTPKPFTVNTLAERWDCGPDVVYRLVESGKLQAFRLGGKLIRIRLDEVERFECQNTDLSNTEADGQSPSSTASEDVFASRLARMTEAPPKPARQASGQRGKSQSARS